MKIIRFEKDHYTMLNSFTWIDLHNVNKIERNFMKIDGKTIK